MRFLFSFLVVALTLAFLITALIYLVKRAFSDVRLSVSGNNNSAFRDVLEQLRQQVKALMPELAPWDGEMFSLLSLHQQPVRGKGSFRPTSMGYLLSIFQEPIVAFAGLASGKHKVVVARVHDREFVFRKKDKEVEVWLNGEPFGVFAGNALLSADKGARLLAQVEEKPAEQHSEVLLSNGRSVSLTNRARATGPNPRAAVLVKELTREEENAALAIALMRLLV
ncbi:MAG: hypothetical protein RMJ33_09060 [Saprospiraceae bacterium]|nr:hypothetical protein [Saprospiraceae bacterium]MDW8229973.1 hypothetical protein [Saprospiraceae bacterium]